MKLTAMPAEIAYTRTANTVYAEDTTVPNGSTSSFRTGDPVAQFSKDIRHWVESARQQKRSYTQALAAA